MHSLEFRGTGVFSAPERCDEVVLVTSQQAVALMGEQATEAQITQPNAVASYGQASVREALEGVELVGIEKRYGCRFAKRTFDIAFSALMIVGFCWLFALPAKSRTNKGKTFSQVASCLSSDLRKRRISDFTCNCIGGMKTQFLAKPVFGVSPEHTGALFQKLNKGLAEAAW